MEQKKKLGLISIILFGINGIIGSGIFLLPGKVYTQAGSKSILIYILATLLVLSIILCFAEAGGMFNRMVELIYMQKRLLVNLLDLKLV